MDRDTIEACAKVAENLGGKFISFTEFEGHYHIPEVAAWRIAQAIRAISSVDTTKTR